MTPKNRDSGPLEAFKVVEFATLGPAPFATMLLVQAGADVIAVDRPGTRAASAIDEGRARLPLDLKSRRGLHDALALVREADILVEGFRPGVMERLGLGPDECMALNPRLIYARMTGWGQEGPRRHDAGHDINYLSLTGALGSIGRIGHAPVPPLNLVGDYGGGAMFLVFGVLAALVERERSGRGQVVDAAMIDGVSVLMAEIWDRHGQGRWSGEAGTNDFDSGAPFYDVYATSDGKFMAVGAVEPQFWRLCVQHVGLDPDKLSDQWDRSSWPALKKLVAGRFRTRSQAEWIEAFAGVDACVTPVLGLADVTSDPHIRARATITVSGNTPLPAPAPRLARTPLQPARPTPLLQALERWGVVPELARELAQTGDVID